MWQPQIAGYRLFSQGGYMGIGARIASALRALRGHTQPCHTCRGVVQELRREIADLQVWAVEWDQRLSELLEKQRTQYARMRGRDQKLREEVVERVMTDLQEGAQNGPGPLGPGEGGPLLDPEARKRELRRRAMERGLMR